MNHRERLKRYAQAARLRKERVDRVSQDNNRGRDYWREYINDSTPEDSVAYDEASRIASSLAQDIDDFDYSSKQSFTRDLKSAIDEAKNLVTALQAYQQDILDEYEQYAQSALSD